MGWRVISRSLGFVSTLILAQLLVPADIGIVALATSISLSIDAFSQIGVRDALVRLKDHREELYDAAFTIQLGRGFLTAAILVALSTVSDSLGDPRIRPVLLVLALTAMIGGAENIGMASLMRDLNFRIQFFMQLGPRLIGFMVTIGLAVIFRSYWALVAGTFISKVGNVAMTYIASPHRPQLRLAGWRYLLSFSLWTWVASITVAIWNRSDPFLIAPYVGTGLLGIYVLAAEIAMLPISELLEPASQTLFPGFAMAQREGNAPARMGLMVAVVLAFGTIPFALALSATSGYVVAGLLGHKWDACQPVIAVLTWLCVFSPFGYVSALALSVEGRVREVAIAQGLAALLKVAALVWIRETRDLMIVAEVVVAAFAFEAMISIFQLRKVGKGEMRGFVMTAARTILATAICAILLRFVPGTWSTVTLDRIPALFWGGFIGAMTFVIFPSLLAGLWFLSGRPGGAESRALRIFQDKFMRPCPVD
ncbi:MAG: oligosaccharide flippase family protein [Alphaproteobacteria bacterium]|nr:oligosaccharide flippase family protein [Alphaproteobacteria bacterium]